MSDNISKVNSHYKLFVDGKLLTQSTSYEQIFQRGLGISLYLELEFINPKSGNIMDRWVNKENTHLIIITKEKY